MHVLVLDRTVVEGLPQPAVLRCTAPCLLASMHPCECAAISEQARAQGPAFLFLFGACGHFRSQPYQIHHPPLEVTPAAPTTPFFPDLCLAFSGCVGGGDSGRYSGEPGQEQEQEEEEAEGGRA